MDVTPTRSKSAPCTMNIAPVFAHLIVIPLYLARAVFSWPENFNHESLLSLFHFATLTSDARFVFSKSIFTPSGRNRETLNISFMNDTYILYDGKDKIATKPPEAEL
jgi:hypothetical protein